jgi:GT2 family glycosyltransferase
LLKAWRKKRGGLPRFLRACGFDFAMNPTVSIILATRNRKTAVLNTLSRIGECGLSGAAYEVIVVDNDSTDDSTDAIERSFPEVNLIRLDRNGGACAKNAALPHARGRYVLFLDDDSHPLPGSLEALIRHFQQDPRLGAAAFDVILPDGRRECSAYPSVFTGCGVGLRRSAIDDVGGLPDDFFMQAEEYDLSLRLLNRGWRVRRFEDLQVLHEKSPAARCSAQKMRLDVRNNLLVAMRRFPREWVGPFVHDWMTRYWAIAAKTGRRIAAVQGFFEGGLSVLKRREFVPVSDEAFQTFARVEETRKRVADLKKQLGLRRVLLIDWGKNILAYRLACEAAGLEIVAVADEQLAGRRYRGIDVVADAEAARRPFDAAIVANLSPVHAAARLAHWRGRTERAVIDLFEPDRLAGAALSAA